MMHLPINAQDLGTNYRARILRYDKGLYQRSSIEAKTDLDETLSTRRMKEEIAVLLSHDRSLLYCFA